MTSVNFIDLRSDTVTRPTAGMRAAMAAAEVGDDVFGDDPTVNRLQAVAAERFGFESALFFPTGTQSNLAALMAHCGRGDEYMVGQEAHTYKYEQGGAAVLGSIQPQPLENEAHGGISHWSASPRRSSRTTIILPAPDCWRSRIRSAAACCRWTICSTPRNLRIRADLRRIWMARACSTPSSN